MTAEPRRRQLALHRPLDLRLTLAPTRTGRGDPCTRLRSDQALRASRTPDGPVTLHLHAQGDRLDATAWGPGAEWALEQVPQLVGEHDRAPLETDHPLVADLLARTPGLRIGATHRVFEAIVPAVCGQRVSAFEAKRAFRQVVEAFGEPAPGDAGKDLLVPPDPGMLASAGYHQLHPIGLERRRADVIRRAAARSATVEAIIDQAPEVAEQHLRSITGVSVWTAAHVRQSALGDPDVVPVGDASSKHLVAFVFLGERHGTDSQMLELLEPFRGHRGRVLRLLQAAGLGPPRHDQEVGDRH